MATIMSVDPQRILPEPYREMLARERALLGDLRTILARQQAPAEAQAALADSLAQLDELFSLVVVGEFNAGKSVFVNALLGEHLLLEGVTPTTSRIHLVRWGEILRTTTSPDGFEVVETPNDLLRDLVVVDTPGTNAIDREHEALTQRFVPRADQVLFVTSADRPFTESERAFLEQLRDWGKKIVIAINKVDILEGEAELAEVREFVATSARGLLGLEPAIFAVSARRALRHKLDSAELADPGFEELEAHVRSILDEEERVRLKLSNPLGVGLRVGKQQRAELEERLRLLSGDLTTLADLESQAERYREDMEREFRFRMGDIEKLVHRMENRGVEFFDERLRLLRIPELLNRSQTQLQFEREVIGDTPAQIESQVRDLIDWMVESELRQWQAVVEHTRRRQAAHGSRVVGESGAGGFESSREQLLARLGRGASRAMEDYDRQHEAERMADSVRTAVAGSAVLQAGAVGLGGLVALVASSTAVDITGILAAGAMATLGLFVIPAKREQAKRQLRKRLAVMRDQLIGGLETEFGDEIGRSLRRLEEATAPYTRFVRSERERLALEVEDLEAVLGGMIELEGQLEKA